jgi:hypothetical protein
MLTRLYFMCCIVMVSPHPAVRQILTSSAGIAFFVVICLCNFFNMMVWLLAPPTLVALSK